MDEESVTITTLEGYVTFRSFCSCSEYTSKQYGYPGLAEAAGKAHARMKHPKSTILTKRG